MPGVLGTLFLTSYPVLWLHEMGHVAAAWLLHVPGPLKVQVVPFVGGSVHLGGLPLNDLGLELGAPLSRLLVAGAGPAADVLLALVLMAVGYATRWVAPAAGRAMMGMSMGVMALPVTYALTTVAVAPGPRNDFAAVQALTGVPPWLVAVALCGLLALEYRLLVGLRRLLRRS